MGKTYPGHSAGILHANDDQRHTKGINMNPGQGERGDSHRPHYNNVSSELAIPFFGL